MRDKPLFVILSVVFLLLVSGIFVKALADRDDHGEKRRHQNREQERHSENDDRNLPLLDNPTYTEQCGACHFTYQPGLLPSGSWQKILNNPGNHFGEELEIDPEALPIIAQYLDANAADHSPTKLSERIIRSLGGQIPSRITQIPYIQRKHHDLSLGVFKRTSIGSFSNCLACHKTAEKGVYDDDDVVIPK